MCWAYHPGWEDLSCFKRHKYSSLCSKCVLPMALGLPLGYVCPLKREVGFLPLEHRRGTHRQIALHGLLGETHWPWGRMSAIESDLALSLLCVCTALFCPGLDCVVFSLAIRISRCSRQRCLESSPENGHRCPAILLPWG